MPDAAAMDMIVRCGSFPAADTAETIRTALRRGCDGVAVGLLPKRRIPTWEIEDLVDAVGPASSLMVMAPWTPWGPLFDAALGTLKDLVESRKDARAFGPLIVSTYDAVMARRLVRSLPDAWIALSQPQEATLPQAIARASAVDAHAVDVPARTALAEPFGIRRAEESSISTMCSGIERVVDAQLLHLAGVVAAVTKDPSLPLQVRRQAREREAAPA